MLVDAPHPDARVRLDLNGGDETGGGPYVEADGFTLGFPIVDGEPTAVGASYGTRSASFTLRIAGEKSEALSVQATLWRELARPAAWLLFQLDRFTKPVWMRVYRAASDAPLSLDEVRVDPRSGGPGSLPDSWSIPLTLTAEALLYGQRVALDPVTMGNDLSGDYPMRWALPALKGDAPTGLRVTVAPTGAGDEGHTAGFLLGVVSSDVAVTDLLIDVGVGDGWTAGSGTSAPVTDADYLGGSYRTVTITTGGDLSLGSAEFATRITGTIEGLRPGRYKVWHRCELDPIDPDDPQRYAFSFGQYANGLVQWGPVVYQATGSLAPDAVPPIGTSAPFQGWVDLGEHTFPLGVDLPVDLPEATDELSVDVALSVGTVGGVGTARLDAFKLVPVDGPVIRNATAMVSQFEAETEGVVAPSPALSGDYSCTWDASVSGLAWMADATSPVAGAPILRGGFPVADPGAAQNVLVAFPTSRGRSEEDDTGTAAAAEWVATVSYHPRHLHLPGEAPTP